ncbi:hypothetical protein QZM93_37570 [Burkholderia cepacia]|uniref:hypothetical protein n=1 Tax=Burkholderia cepacia TaxID=292 RepID=UPI0011ABC8F2|nr:hypothetical protein [Burkholderia cepacia]MDN7894315.1 hypothetical protein [Burkholderia cepacia]
MKMVDVNASGVDRGIIALGALLPLWLFKPRPEGTFGLADNTPVLTCPVSESDAHHLMTRHRGSCLSFGRIDLGDDVLMTIRLQFGDVQVCWLADVNDPQLWESIELWKRAGRVPTMLSIHAGEGRQQFFGVSDMPSNLPSMDAAWYGPDNFPTRYDWDRMGSLVASGSWLVNPTTDIQGVPVRHVFANVLLTKRLEQFVA